MFPVKTNKKEGSELLRTLSLFVCLFVLMLKHSNSFTTRYKTEAIRLEQIISHQIRGGSRGRVQGVRTPPWDDLRFSNTTGILQKKKIVCGLLVLK